MHIDDELTEQQEKFCQEYAKTGKGKQSGIRAGYSEQSAYSQASRLLKQDKIKKRINMIKSEFTEQSNKEKETLVNWLWDIIDPKNNESTGMRIKAGEVIAKIHGWYTETKIVKNENGDEVDVSKMGIDELDELLIKLEQRANDKIITKPDLKLIKGE